MKCKRMIVSSDFILHNLLKGTRHKFMVSKGLPEGTRIIDVRHKWPSDIELLMENDEWPEVKSGEFIPEINVEFTSTV